MDKRFVKNVLAVVLGISIIIMIYETVSLFTDAVLMNDLKFFQSSGLNALQKFMKWSALGLVCLIVPTLVCYALTFWAKRKIFTLLSAILSFVVVVCCIVSLCITHSYALQGLSQTNYISAVGYISEYLKTAVAAVLIGAYFLIKTFTAKVVVETASCGEAENEKN